MNKSLLWRQHPFLLTLLSNIAETLVLQGLVIYHALDFGSGAVDIRILKKRQNKAKKKHNKMGKTSV